MILLEQLKAKHPEFIEELKKKVRTRRLRSLNKQTYPLTLCQGVKYQLTHPNGPRDQTSSAGTTVLQAYGQHVLDSDDTETTRAKIETEIRRLPTATWEWRNQSETNQLGDLRVWQVLPAIRNHPRTGQPAFFNNVVSRFLNALKNETLLPPHLNKKGDYQPPCFVSFDLLCSLPNDLADWCSKYGDGSLIPSEYLESAVEFIYQTRSLVTWKKGDVILIDNHAVQHAREPWTGERKLLASLWDEPLAA